MSLVLKFLQNRSKIAFASQIDQSTTKVTNTVRIPKIITLDYIFWHDEDHPPSGRLLVAAASGHEEVVRLLVAWDDVDVNSIIYFIL